MQKEGPECVHIVQIGFPRQWRAAIAGSRNRRRETLTNVRATQADWQDHFAPLLESGARVLPYAS